jgi:hypothetical protein
MCIKKLPLTSVDDRDEIPVLGPEEEVGCGVQAGNDVEIADEMRLVVVAGTAVLHETDKSEGSFRSLSTASDRRSDRSFR